MSLHHHDAREYNEAKTEAAANFRSKLEQEILEGQGSAMAVIRRLQDEVPIDRVVNTRSVEFTKYKGANDPHVIRLWRNAGGNQFFNDPLHPHATRQIAQILGIPVTYINSLMNKGDWGMNLILENLNEHMRREDSRRVLTRTVGGQIRGILSDSYRRMDSRPVLDAFAGACADVGAVPVQGQASDLRFTVKALLPKVFEPRGEEFLAFGLRIANSDFGAGALSLSVFVDRLWCTNHAVMSSELRQVHLGRRLSEDIEFSEETYRKDTETMALAVRDMVRGLLGPVKVNQTLQAIEQAIDTKVDVKDVLEKLKKQNRLQVGEAQEIRDIYNDGGVEMLPRGNTVYRMSNAISWFAKSQRVDRKMELEELAGEVIQKG